MAITSLTGVTQAPAWQNVFATVQNESNLDVKSTESDEKINSDTVDINAEETAEEQGVAASALPGEEKDDGKPIDLQKMLEEIKSSKIEIAPPAVEDDTAQLTARLVSATVQMEVRQIIAQASKNMLGLRMAAAASSGPEAEKAKTVLRKIEKLIDRADRKIEDLNKEDSLKFQQKRAEQQKHESRADEIKAELRRKIRERMNRERKYLTEGENEKNNEQGLPSIPGASENPAQKLDAASEAQIAAEAEAQLAAETGSVGGGDIGGGMDAALSASSEQGGETASGAGAQGGGEVAAEGASMDISV